MKIKILIIIDNDEEKDFIMDINKNGDEYIYTIAFPCEEKYYQFLKSKNISKNNIDEYNEDGYNYLINNIATFNNKLNETNPIYILLDIIDLKYINNKNTIILDISNLSYQDKLLIINKINRENVYFMDKYTSNEILSLQDIKYIYQKIENLANIFKQHSPLEQLYGIYNLLKSRPYLKENPQEDAKISRSLKYILNNEPIVCLGFCNLFMAICDALNINTAFIRYENDTYGHVSIMCFINDPKYEIKGIFSIDPTWDNLNFNTIKHFLLPIKIEEIEKYTKGYRLRSNQNVFYQLIEKYNNYLKLTDNEQIIKEREELIEYINIIYYLLNINKEVDYLCDLFTEINHIMDLTKVDINPIILYDVIKNIEHIDNETYLSLLETSYHYTSLNNKDKALIRGFLNGSNSRNR